MNKSEHIRQAFAELGKDAANKEIINLLKEKGVEVESQHISNVKKYVPKCKKRDIENLSTLERLKNLVEDVGSTEIVRAMLDLLDKQR